MTREGHLCQICSRSIKNTCTGYEWYEIREIRFCVWQVMFLLENIGEYPPDPHVSGYTDAAHTSTRIGANAPFEAQAVLWAEIDYRLKQTGLAGNWLRREIDNGVTLGELPYEPRSALHYISGWARKRMSYGAWLKQREYRQKLTTKTHQKQAKFDKIALRV